MKDKIANFSGKKGAAQKEQKVNIKILEKGEDIKSRNVHFATA